MKDGVLIKVNEKGCIETIKIGENLDQYFINGLYQRSFFKKEYNFIEPEENIIKIKKVVNCRVLEVFIFLLDLFNVKYKIIRSEE